MSADLDGAELDLAVAKALGKEAIITDSGHCRVRTVGRLTAPFSPTTNGELVMKLIEAHKIDLKFFGTDTVVASCDGVATSASTAMKAVLRAFVSAHKPVLPKDSVLIDQSPIDTANEKLNALIVDYKNLCSQNSMLFDEITRLSKEISVLRLEQSKCTI